MIDNDLIFGKDKTENIVSCEIMDDKIVQFIQNPDGTVEKKFVDNIYYILANEKLDYAFNELKGGLHYRYAKKYHSKTAFLGDKRKYQNEDTYSIFDDKEAAMLIKGFTYFKGMKVPDVPVLAFDLETTGLEHDSNAKILLIANSYSYKGKVTRKLFAYDEYQDQKAMLKAWCKWVRDVNPAIMLGHNIYMYDLPYLQHCADMANINLDLGRDSSPLWFDKYESKFRRDGSQFYNYTKSHIFGREIIDTFFLSIKYDVERKYPSYRLKSIIEFEGLEVKDRQHYDASTIHQNYTNPEEWKKIKKYAEHDGDDALVLYYKMVPPFFYLAQSVPFSFENMVNKATGSQVNATITRGYLQQFHSIPRADAKVEFEGAISIGNPGVYHNCFKVDVASLYPSIIRHYKVCNRKKDPNEITLKLTEYFAIERLKNKKLAEDMKDEYYKNLSDSQKVFINSIYGFLGAPGLAFNSPSDAAFITLKGREILTTSMDWAKTNNFTIANADTDSILICKDNKPINDEEKEKILGEINALYPALIKFTNDGYYKHALIIKAKNYMLESFKPDKTGKTRKIKGAALKATTKEFALQEFISEMIEALTTRKKDKVLFIYNKYVREIYQLKDIKRWSSKKTVTENVLDPQRTNEQKVFNAIIDSDYQISDKIFTYFDKFDQLKLQENWCGDHSEEKLLGKLHSTLEIFDTVLDVECFPDYTLKRNKEYLHEVLSVKSA